VTSPETLLHVDERKWSVRTWEIECARSLVDAQRRRRDADRRLRRRRALRIVALVLLVLAAVAVVWIAVQ
jgi:hypothetical protein